MDTPRESHKGFISNEPGCLHVDLKHLPQMAAESKRRCLFVAINWATRWVFVEVKNNKTAACRKSFLGALHRARPLKILKLLPDNGKGFTNRLLVRRER